jgi:DNA-binding NarL/FixJ family response regulator
MGIVEGERTTMKVFIADDSPVLCERLKVMLSDLPGIEIIGQAGEVPEATESFRALRPGVVILDIRMPGGSGIDVLENIKKANGAPVVIMPTNYPFPQYRKKCMALGAEYFFDKSTEFKKAVHVCKQLAKIFEPTNCKEQLANE